jgi:hypothetical protein
MTSEKQVQPATQKKCAQGYVRWPRLKVLEPASWSRIPSRHERLIPTTSQKEKRDFERPKTHKKEHRSRPSTSDAPDNNTSKNLDARESKRRRAQARTREREREKREVTNHGEGGERYEHAQTGREASNKGEGSGRILEENQRDLCQFGSRSGLRNQVFFLSLSIFLIFFLFPFFRYLSSCIHNRV